MAANREELMRITLLAAIAALAIAGPSFAYQTGGSGHNTAAAQSGTHSSGGGGGAGKGQAITSVEHPRRCAPGKTCPRP
jgi:hypothetical protein